MPGAELAIGSPTHPLFDLGHLSRSVLEHELIGLCLEQIWEVSGIRLLRVRQLAERPEADVQAEVHAGNAVDAGVEQPGDVGSGVRVVGCIPGRGRLVELYPLAPGRGELADLVVQRGHERLGEMGAIGVVVHGTDEGGERERTRQRDLDRPCRAGRRVGELVDRAHPVRHAHRTDGLLNIAHVERHRAHLARRTAVAETRHSRGERPHEAGPAHLPVADDVKACLLLVEDGPINGVVERLLDIDGPEPVGLHQFLRGVEPRWMGVAADHRCWQHWQTLWHAVERSRRETCQAIAVTDDAPR